jgi:hypothetical protein
MSTANWERRIGSFLVFLCMPMASLTLCIGTTLLATIPLELSSRHGRETNNGVYLIIQSPDLACYDFPFIFIAHDTHPYSPYPVHVTCMHLNGAAIVGLYACPNCMFEGLALIARWGPMTPQVKETFLTCKSYRRKNFRSQHLPLNQDGRLITRMRQANRDSYHAYSRHMVQMMLQRMVLLVLHVPHITRDQ